MIFSRFGVLVLAGVAAAGYTHRLIEDFSKYPDINNILKDEKAKHLTDNWMFYDF